MKCRELQFGDWCCNKHGFPMQITNVGEDYAYATWEDNEGDPWEYDDKDEQPQPIPLTNDILRKNDWMAESFMPYWHSFVLAYYFVKDEGDTHLEFKCDILKIWFNYEKDNYGVYADVIVPVKYVHQLQQVLRLAGMTDMANNFKI